MRSPSQLLPMVFALVFVLVWTGFPARSGSRSRGQSPALFSADGSNSASADIDAADDDDERVTEISLAVEVLYSQQYYKAATETLRSIDDVTLRDKVLASSLNAISIQLGITGQDPLDVNRINASGNKNGELSAFLRTATDFATNPILKSHLEIRYAQYLDKLGPPLDADQEVVQRIQDATEKIEATNANTAIAFWSELPKLGWAMLVSSFAVLGTWSAQLLNGFLGGLGQGLYGKVAKGDGEEITEA